MGAATVAENSLRATTDSLWSRLPRLPAALPDLDLAKYNRSFVNFAIVVGVAALAQSALSLAGRALKAKPKVPSRQQLLEKYGHMAWAVVSDCKYNYEYVAFLARNGFNLVLMGEEANVRQCRELAQRIDGSLRIEEIAVDWARSETDLEFYEGVVRRLEEHDVAFLVLPRLEKEKGLIPTHLEREQPFQHVYLLVRYFGHKLKFRSYRSAILFPSYPDADRLAPYNGLTQGLIAGSDAFGRIISYELKGTVEVVVARGSVENAFAGLGLQKITH